LFSNCRTCRRHHSVDPGFDDAVSDQHCNASACKIVKFQDVADICNHYSGKSNGPDKLDVNVSAFFNQGLAVGSAVHQVDSGQKFDVQPAPVFVEEEPSVLGDDSTVKLGRSCAQPIECELSFEIGPVRRHVEDPGFDDRRVLA
jgi:hypothetical protein